MDTSIKQINTLLLLIQMPLVSLSVSASENNDAYIFVCFLVSMMVCKMSQILNSNPDSNFYVC